MVDIYRMMYIITPKLLSEKGTSCWHCDYITNQSSTQLIINLWQWAGEEPKSFTIPDDICSCEYCNHEAHFELTYTIVKKKFVETIISLAETLRLFPNITNDPYYIDYTKHPVDYIGSFD